MPAGNRQYDLIFAKFSLSFIQPLPYKRNAWYYDSANTDLTRKVQRPREELLNIQDEEL